MTKIVYVSTVNSRDCGIGYILQRSLLLMVISYFAPVWQFCMPVNVC